MKIVVMEVDYEKEMLDCYYVGCSPLFCGCGAGKGYSKTEKEERFSQLDALQMNGPEEVLSRFPEKNIFLLGEMHGVKESFEIELAFLEAMAKEHTEIQIVLEFSPCKTFALKQYIETGDEKILLNTIKNAEGSYTFSNDYVNFFQKIREFHEKGISLHLIGVDQEFTAMDIISALELLNKERFKQEIEQIQLVQNNLSELIYQLDSCTRKWKKILTESKEDQELKKIIGGIEDYCVAVRTARDDRDVPMFQRFKEWVNPELATLGIFGVYHLCKQVNPTYKNMIPYLQKTLGECLIEDEIFQERVALANMFYIDTVGMTRDGGEDEILSEIPRNEPLIDHALKSSESTVWYQTKGLPQNLYDEPLENWCDFVMIVKYGKAATFFNK
ncbi:MAG: hypothetical protein Q4Q17_00605 [Tissierellia bacterium]|nr:hypothetical protein [Tissierellia bacterium]